MHDVDESAEISTHGFESKPGWGRPLDNRMSGSRLDHSVTAKSRCARRPISPEDTSLTRDHDRAYGPSVAAAITGLSKSHRSSLSRLRVCWSRLPERDVSVGPLDWTSELVSSSVESVAPYLQATSVERGIVMGLEQIVLTARP